MTHDIIIDYKINIDYNNYLVFAFCLIKIVIVTL